MLFRLYNRLMGLAKESLQGDAETPEEVESSGVINLAAAKGPEMVDLGPDTGPGVLVLVDKLKELLKELPRANIATLSYIIRHLRRSGREETQEEETPSSFIYSPSFLSQDCRAGGRQQDESQ